jgi:NADH-quinone oxidoreductase subunit G
MPVRPGEAHLVAEALTRSDGAAPQGSLISDAELTHARSLIGPTGAGVVVVIGRPNLAEDAAVLERAVRVLAESFPDATFLPALRRANVMGALDMGLAPNLRPGRAYERDESRDALAQLAALRAGEQKAVVLLGNLLGNVLDDDGAAKALEAAHVVVVTGHGGATLAYADVVLPAAVQHERLGTVTNIEGRVTAVTAKIVAPGSAWPDVAIASELAEQCGQSLGLASVEQAAKVLEATTGYPALSVLNDVSDEGVLVGRRGDRVERRALDPMAFPGIKSINTVGLGELSGAVIEDHVTEAASPTGASLSDVAAGRKVEVPNYDAYAVALLVSRRLYDHGVAVQGSPALANLVAKTTAYLNHFDLDRLGLTTGDQVNVIGLNGTHTVPVTLSDATPRGVLDVVFGAVDDDGSDGVARALFDPASIITQVRLATS